MPDRAFWRLENMKTAIHDIRHLLSLEKVVDVLIARFDKSGK